MHKNYRYNALAMPKKERRNPDDEHGELDDRQQEVDEIEFEDDGKTSEEKIKELRTALRACQKEKQAYLDGWQREKADSLNIKKRQADEMARERDRARADHVKRLLPLCDSFAMAMQDVSWEAADEKWRQGITQINDQLERILTEYNVTALGTAGEEFDPHIHEAVSNAPTTQKKEHNKVLSVFQKGYQMDGELVRPAKVVVGEYKEE